MLTDTQCRSAKGEGAAYRLTDSRGLFLYVTPSGVRSWRWKYRFEGKQSQLVLGRYPEMSIKAARDARDAADRIRRGGIDPARQKPDADSEATFEALARQWHKQNKGRWREKHAGIILRSLEQDVFPAIGAKQIGEIKAPAVLTLLRKVEARGAVDQAHRLRQRIDAIFAMGIGAGIAEANPAAMVAKALSPVIIGRHPALRSLEDARELIRAVEDAPGQPTMKLASRFLAITAARSEAMRYAEWGEIEEGEKPQWRIPGAHMKGERANRNDPDFEFIIPLPPQALEVVKAVKALTGNAKLIFPGTRDPRRPMSDATISAMYRRLPAFSGRHVPHGWRSTFSTVMNEWALEHGRPGDREVIDIMLAHVRGGVEGRYNRAAFMPRRRELAQLWADMLLEGLPPASSLLEGKRC